MEEGQWLNENETKNICDNCELTKFYIHVRIVMNIFVNVVVKRYIKVVNVVIMIIMKFKSVI